MGLEHEASNTVSIQSDLSLKPALRSVVAGLLGLLLIVLVTLLGAQTIGIGRLRLVVEGAGWWAPLLYLVLTIVAYIIPPIPGAALQMSAGALFGLEKGIVLTLLGDTVGGSADFWIARLFGRPLVRRCVGDRGMVAVDRIHRRLGGWRFLLPARLLLSSVYDFVSYAAGLTTLSFRHYLPITLIVGVLPTALSVALGAGTAGLGDCLSHHPTDWSTCLSTLHLP